MFLIIQGENTSSAILAKIRPYPIAPKRPCFEPWSYLEQIKVAKRLSRKKLIKPLYFVPMASPQKTAERMRNLKRNPFSDHFRSKSSDAVEKKMSPRST
jgi:hypothetical protein